MTLKRKENNMGQYKIFWNLQESGKEIVEANSEEEAREKFAAMLLTDLLGHNQNFAHIGMIYEMKDNK